MGALRMINALRDSLFPQQCKLCGLASHQPLALCDPCRADLHANLCCCPRCALPLDDAPDDLTGAERAVFEPERCTHCHTQAHTIAYDSACAPWLYDDHLAYLIARWKFEGERQLTPLLGTLWCDRAHTLPMVDRLIPVPLHWRRRWRRGFNQAALLAHFIARNHPALKDSMVDESLLRRRRATMAQSSMSAELRAVNLVDAFTVQKRCDNLRIAVIDDVLTTGATANTLARALKQAGAAEVHVWCLARTPSPATEPEN